MNPTEPTPPIVPGQTPTPPPSPKPLDRGYSHLIKKANQTSRVIALLVVISLIGTLSGFLIAQYTKNNQPASKAKNSVLTADELAKLGVVGPNIGSATQSLTIGAATQFNNNVVVAKDVAISGKLSSLGPLSASTISVSGTNSLFNGLVDGGDLKVAGSTILQSGATVGQLLTVTGNLNVAGVATANTINASTLNVKTINITGPFTFSHIQTQGGLPTAVSGGAVGAGGTVSISGNDTSGTIVINVGGNNPFGTLVSVTFRAPYSSNVKVLLTPTSGPAGSAPVYVTKSSTGFQLKTDLPLTSGTLLSFDYLVVQ